MIATVTTGNVLLELLWLTGYLALLGCFAAAITETLGQDGDHEEALLDTVVLMCATHGALTLGLGLVGALGRVPILVCGAALGMGGVWLRGPRVVSRATGWLRTAARPFVRSPLLIPPTLLGLLLLARGLSIPQLAWDGLSYHLTYPATWLRHGAIVRFEAGGVWESYETFPKGVEALFHLVMVAFGRDYLVNLVNLPLWFMTAVALRVLLRRCEVRPLIADGAAMLVLFSPALANYVTPAYTEVPKTLALLAMASAVARVSISRDTRALVTMGIALGWALSIKITALSWCPAALLVALFALRDHGRAALRHVGLGAAASVLIGGGWYLHNAVRCGGNPLYPAGLPGATAGPLAGSERLAWAIRESSVISLWRFETLFDELSAPPWKVPHALGPGWSILLAVPAALLLTPFARGVMRRRALWSLGVMTALLDLYLNMPHNGLYITSGVRFLGPTFVMATVAAAIALEGLPAAAHKPVGLPLLAVTVGVSLAGLLRQSLLQDPALSNASLWVAAAVGLGWLTLAWWPAERMRPLPLAATTLAAVLTLPTALRYRETHRFDEHFDLHPVHWKGLWDDVAALPPSRIAYVAGGWGGIEGWFFFPLFGADLRHDVTYVDIEADGDLRACQRRGQIRDEPDVDAWLGRLRSRGIDYVLVTGESPELEWMQQRPTQFILVVEASGPRLFRFSP